MSRSTALVFELWKFNYKSEIDTKTLIYGGPGVRLLRKKTKKRLFGIFKQNNYAGSNVIDFQIFFSYNDGKTIGPDLLAIEPAQKRKFPSYDANQQNVSLNDYFVSFVLENQDQMTETGLSQKLGISRKALWQKRQKLGIPREKSRSR